MYKKDLLIYVTGLSQELTRAIQAAIPDDCASIASSEEPDRKLAEKAGLIVAGPNCQVTQLGQLKSWLRDPADLILVAGKLPGADQGVIDDIWPADETAMRFHIKAWLRKFMRLTELREKEYFFERLLAASPNMVWFKSKDGVHEIVNNSFCLAVNKTREQVQGRRHAYIWNVDNDDPACIASEDIVMQSGKIHETEEEITSGSERRLLAVRKAPLYDQDGAIMGTMGIGVDITNEREYQKKLIHNNDMLETLFSTMDCGMVCHSLDGQRIVAANRTALRLLGYEKVDDLQSHFKTVADSVLDEDKPVVRSALARLNKEGDSASYEYRVAKPDGSLYHIIGNARVVEKNGELICRRFLFDCTEQKMAEEKERREAERRQKELVRALSVDFQLVYIADNSPDRILQLLDGPDQELKRIFSQGKPLAENIEEYIATRVHPDDREASRHAFSAETLREKLAAGKIFSFNYRTLDDDQVHYYRMKAMAAGDTEKKFGILVGLQSIDETMRAELEQKSIMAEALKQAQQANSAKSIFLSNMSHDIRTPLNAVLGYARLAMNRLDKPETVSAYLEKIQNSGSHLISLINDILDMSHIESGKIHLDERLCGLPDLIAEILAIIQPDADHKGQTLTVEMEQIANPDIFCDKLRLKQVLLNLLSNAVKYTPEKGSIVFAIRQLIAPQDGQAAYEFQVRDNGIGMSSEFLERIFQPFERASNVGAIQGTGLGMAITKSIIDLMKGQISVVSEPGKGTTFTLSLTFRIPEDQHATGGSQDAEVMDEQQRHGGRILLAEDNEMNQEIACEILSEAGYEIEVANTGKEAVEALKQHGPGYFDIVLMDVQMPVMDGYTATVQIRALPDKELATIPIVAMTANSFEEDRQEALSHGMNAHIAKPINFPDLFSTLDHFLADKQPAKLEMGAEG